MVLSKIEANKNKINEQTTFCRDFIRTLNTVSFKAADILQWFNELCQHLVKIIIFIGNLNKELDGKLSNRDNVVLYLTQLLTTLSLLINVFVKENELNETIMEARYCVTKHIICCLHGIEDSLTLTEIIELPGSFLKWMDTALDKVAEVDIRKGKIEALEICNKTRQLFEEVLCHAMSIAQIALTQDCKIIKGSSQTVLEALDSLVDEVNSTAPNTAMINLFVDTCTNKLCLLERKVNTAVLKLCLKIFSEYTVPLEKIHDFCLNATNKERTEEFDNLVIDFDLHVDRIMQIGLFAVSCSSGINRSIKIRSCLASLEAMETELVPAFRAALLDCSSHNINYALVLKDYWLQQAEALQEFIYLIVDPFAFCQVIFEETKEQIDDLSDLLKHQINLKSNNLNTILKNAGVLKIFIQIASKEFNEIELLKVKAQLKVFIDVLHEVDCASKILLNNTETSAENSLRVLKRCKILLGIIKQLWYCFADDTTEQQISVAEVEKDFSINMENVQPTGNAFLDHIINRGKQILKERSVLYRTPMKNNGLFLRKFSQNKDENKPTSLSKLIHLRKLSFNNIGNETSMDLQITEILNEISHLSSTFIKIK